MEQAVLDQGAGKFGKGAYSLKLLGGFDQSVFEYAGEDGSRFVLKFLDAAKYPKAAIIRELTWMAHLARHGLRITESVTSREGLLIEEVAHHGQLFYVVAFTIAPGQPLTDLESDAAVIERWGRGLGKMHALGKHDSAALLHRMGFAQWDSHPIFTDEFPAAAGEKVHIRWKEYLKVLASLPQDPQSYGIVHNDLHHRNFHVHDGDIVFFDFGDIGYHWYAYDIAISIYHAVQTVPGPRKAEFAARFCDALLTGYLQEHPLSNDWIKRIPFFIDFRNVYSFVYFSKYVDWHELDERTRKYLAGMKADIEAGTPVVHLPIS